MDQSRKSILATIIYSDIFDYPLYKAEVSRYYLRLSEASVASSVAIQQSLDALVAEKVLVYVDTFYCLRGRESIIKKRLQRRKSSEKKLSIARTIAKILFYIPTVQLLGISGSLAMENATDEEDIDFFIITKAHTLWITRIIIICLLEIGGVRRRRSEKITANKICVNMFIDEQELKLPKEMQNIFTAHEVIQMKPLFMRSNMNKKFLYANKWVENVLPLANSAVSFDSSLEINKKNKTTNVIYIEKLFRNIQLKYMQKHRTKEVINTNLLAFHPQDVTKYVLDAFERRLKIYDI